MIFFVLKRIATSLATLFVVMSITFFVMKTIPGGPFDSEKALPAEVKASIDEHFGLNKPLIVQYGKYLVDITKGDLGPSYAYFGSRSVSEVIAIGLPVSIQLGLYALIFALVCGVPLGVIAAAKRNTIFDSATMALAVSGMSLPTFITATVLILVFALKLKWFPAALWDEPASAVLPAITLGLRPLALIARLTRSSMVEVLQMDYIRTAYAKGLRSAVVLFKHALKNSILPVITLLGPITASLLTGSFMVEVMFAIPGIGRYFISAVLDRDYPMIMGVTLVYGVILLFCNLIVDILYGWIDPRLRLEDES